MKVLQHFGLTHLPLFELRGDTALWENPAHKQFKDRFDWLSEQCGVGVLTGESGVGKTALLRHHIHRLAGNQYQILYQCETCFSQNEVYRYFGLELGLSACFRRSEQWRAIKKKVEELNEQSRTLVWVLDELLRFIKTWGQGPFFERAILGSKKHILSVIPKAA